MLTRGISQETTLIEASLDDRPLKDGLHFLSGESGCFSGIGEGKAMKNTIYIYGLLVPASCQDIFCDTDGARRPVYQKLSCVCQENVCRDSPANGEISRSN